MAALIQTPKPLRKRVFIPLLCIFTILLALLFFQIIFAKRIYPFIYINGMSIGGLTPQQAYDKIDKTTTGRLNKKLEFTYQNQQFPIDLSMESSILNLQEAVEEAYSYGHSKFYPQEIFKIKPIAIKTTLTQNKTLKDQLKTISLEINQEAIDAQIKLEGNLVKVSPSQEGKVLDENKFLSDIENYLQTGKQPEKELPTKVSKPKISYEEALSIKKMLDKVSLNPVKLTYLDLTFYLTLKDLIEMVNLTQTKSSLVSIPSFNEFNLSRVKFEDREIEDPVLVVDQEKLKKYLQTIAQRINRPVEEPLFNFDSGRGKVTEFRPGANGLTLNIQKASQEINTALTAEQIKEISLPVDKISPKNKLTNEMGIKELIGRGISHFAGSIPNRIYNIGLAASRINGVLIPPGETFSFTNTVGDISAATGYKQAYVIKSGRTILDDGGGVCQVSTTLFRAVLNSGLPVINRVAHAYRVSYYEQQSGPGLDATIFYPSVDFKFKNDTPGHVLIQSYVAGTSLYVDFYGTSDGRIATVSKSIVTNITPPPPELRQDDPTLPQGTVKQVDWAASGANVSFSRTVTRNGEVVINESFKSNYRPWQAVFLVGTKDN